MKTYKITKGKKECEMKTDADLKEVKKIVPRGWKVKEVK